MPISHPFAKYASGVLTCRACSVAVGEDAKWSSHIATSAHAEAVAVLKAAPRAAATPASTAVGTSAAPLPRSSHVNGAPAPRAVDATVDPSPVAVNPRVNGGDADAAALLTTTAASLRGLASSSWARRNKPAPAKAADSTSAPAAVPLGFFDDAEADMRAHNINPAVAAKEAAEADWKEFQAFMGTVQQAAAVEEVEEETRYVEDRDAAVAAEDALYRGRLDVIRFTRQVLSTGRRIDEDAQGDTAAAAAAGRVSDVAIAELVEEPVSFLTVAERSNVSVDAIRDVLVQKRRREEAAHDENDDDLLDWRRKGPRRA